MGAKAWLGDGVGALTAAVCGIRRGRFYVVLAAVSWTRCALVFLLVSTLMPGDRRPGYNPDSVTYETMAGNLLAGAGLSLSNGPPYAPTMFKEPLYPAFIAAFKTVFGDTIEPVLVAQLLVNPLIAIFVYLIGRRFFEERVARWSALFVAMMPTYGESSFSLMPEGFFMILFLAAMWLLAKLDTDRTPNPAGFVLAGALLGLACLFRNILLPVAVLYSVVFVMRHRGSANRRVMFNTVLFLMSFAIVTTPWMWRNQQRLGLFAISARGGTLFSDQAAWAANFTNDEWKAYGTYLLSGTLAQRMYPHIIGDDLGEYEYAVIMRRAYVADLATRYREGEVESILVGEGMRDALRHPFKFLALSILVALQNVKYLVPDSLLVVRTHPGVPWLVPSMKGLLILVGTIFMGLTVRGIVACRGRLAEMWLVLATTAYFHVASATLGVVPGAIMRYTMPVSVFYSFFIVIAVLERRQALPPAPRSVAA